jgi:hypothetical protein
MSWWVWALVAYGGLLFVLGLWAAVALTVERWRRLADAERPLERPQQNPSTSRVAGLATQSPGGKN